MILDDGDDRIPHVCIYTVMLYYYTNSTEVLGFSNGYSTYLPSVPSVREDRELANYFVIIE